MQGVTSHPNHVRVVIQSPPDRNGNVEGHRSAGDAKRDPVRLTSTDFDADQWALYNLEQDFSECRDLSKTHPDKLTGVSYESGVTGVPLLTDALGHLECVVRGELAAGDHTVFVGEVVEASVRREGPPLTMAETGFRYYG